MRKFTERGKVRSFLYHFYSLRERLKWFFKKKAKVEVLNNDFIVSFTSFAPRLPGAIETTFSLLNQKLRPDKIILYLQNTSDLERGNSPHLTDIRRIAKEAPDRFLLRAAEEQGSYTKLLPALKEFPKANILTCDDDHFYMPHWTSLLMREYPVHSNKIICLRGRRIMPDASYMNWPLISEQCEALDILPTGCGGVLYPKSRPFSVKTLLNYEEARAHAPTTDDFWFRDASLRTRTPVLCLGNAYQHAIFDFSFRFNRYALVGINHNGGNDKSMEYFKEHWKKILEEKK